MSIQFRSRITSAIDYSTILTNYGYCCNSSDPANPTRKTFVECVTEGGYFVQGASGQQVTCPEPDTQLGCCCSCSYVTPDDYNLIDTYPPTTPYLSSGTRSQVTKCECDRLGGVFTPTGDGNCPTLTNANWESFCTAPHPSSPLETIDIRSPRSCCHLEFDDLTGWPTGVICKDVCTSADCALLSTETYPASFTNTERCAIPLTITGTLTNCASATNLSYLVNNKLFEGFDLGSCYDLEMVGGTYEYSCSITPETSCSGYWIIQQDQNNPFCLSDKQPENPQKISGTYTSSSMSLSTFNDIGLTSGDEFQGGIYIGIFKPAPNNARSSEVYGNINFGAPSLERFNADAIGGTQAQWALIVNETKYNVPFLLSDEKETDYSTSLWDGYYNTYGNLNNFQGIKSALTNTIRYQPRNGFIDYYIPSIYELNFYAAYLRRNQITEVGNLISSSIFNTKYISNTSKTTLNNFTFVYGQAIKTAYDVNYRNILINKRHKETVLFFRRILLT